MQIAEENGMEISDKLNEVLVPTRMVEQKAESKDAADTDDDRLAKRLKALTEN